MILQELFMLLFGWIAEKIVGFVTSSYQTQARSRISSRQRKLKTENKKPVDLPVIAESIDEGIDILN